MMHHFKKPKRLGSRPPSVILPGANVRSLYKYFLEPKYAEAFLDGQMLFHSLAYFRDNEDAVRGDEYEGTSKFRPDGGLVVNNQTQGTTFALPMAFESSVTAHEIFVYCVSQTLNAEIAREFNAVACVEVTKVATLCAGIRAALPSTATFRARPVDYYPQTVATRAGRYPITSRHQSWTVGPLRMSIVSFSPLPMRLASRRSSFA
jgi:hypothetical protein